MLYDFVQERIKRILANPDYGYQLLYGQYKQRATGKMADIVDLGEARKKKKREDKKERKEKFVEDLPEEYFREIEEKNKAIARRKERDRKNHNKKVKRDYNLKD